MNSLNPDEILSLVQSIGRGEIDRKELVRLELQEESADLVASPWIVIGGIVFMSVAFANAGTFGAIGVGLMLLQYLNDRWQRSNDFARECDEYFSGESSAVLTPQIRDRLQKNLGSSILKELPPLPQDEDDEPEEEAIATVAEVVPEPAPAQPAATAPSPITPASTPAPPTAIAPSPKPPAGFDIPTLIAKEQFLLSRIWIGPSRTGKSYAVAATQRKVKAKYKKRLTTYVLSGVDRPNEYFYWDECDRVIRFALDSSTDEHAITSAYEAWHECLTEWTAILSSPENPKLLIVDEASLMALKAKTLSIPAGISYWRAIKDRAVSLSSAGSAAGAAIWLITPNGAMGALEFAQHEVGAFNPVFITRTEASAWNETVYITARRNGLTPAQPPSDALRRDAMLKGCDRLAGIGGRWLPYAASSLGQLPPSKPTAPPPPPAPPTPPAAEPEAFVLPEDADLFDDLFEAQPTPAEKFLKWLEGKGQATIEQVKSWTVRIDGKPQKLPAQQLKEMLVQLREAGKIKTLKTPEGNIIQLVKTAALS